MNAADRMPPATPLRLVAAVQPDALPGHAFLGRYLGTGAYTDGYRIDASWRVSQREFIEAFYTSWLFRIERWILAWLVARPSTDEQAGQLAAGLIDRFAAWSVEGQDDSQLLLCDLRERTRSWLMAAPDEASGGTRLWFGSAVVPVTDGAGRKRLGFAYSALLGFHKLYSRMLLRAAANRLRRAKLAPGLS